MKTAPSDWVFAVERKDFRANVLQRSQDVPVVVDFCAPSCRYCRKLSPVLKRLVKERAGEVLLATVNIDEERALAKERGIRSVPTVIAFRGGRPVDTVGLLTEAELGRFLDVIGNMSNARRSAGIMPKDRRMDHFENSLRAMLRLLEAVRVKHWAAWIKEDLRLWQAYGITSHHLYAYGGMGSFNDVSLCRKNGHKVTKAQEPWAGILFQWLKSLCYYLARQPTENVTEASLWKALGRYSPYTCRRHVRGEITLNGSRCRNCGYAEVTNNEIERRIADDLVPLLLFPACEANKLDWLVDRILGLQLPAIEKARRQVLSAAAVSGIRVIDDSKITNSPQCTKCRKKDTTTNCRWKLASGPHFVAADDN